MFDQLYQIFCQKKITASVLTSSSTSVTPERLSMNNSPCNHNLLVVPYVNKTEANNDKISLNYFMTESNTENKKYPDTSKVANKDTLSVSSNENQSLLVPLNSIDLLSSSSNDSDLTNGTLCSPIDDKANNDEDIIKKI